MSNMSCASHVPDSTFSACHGHQFVKLMNKAFSTLPYPNHYLLIRTYSFTRSYHVITSEFPVYMIRWQRLDGERQSCLNHSWILSYSGHIGSLSLTLTRLIEILWTKPKFSPMILHRSSITAPNHSKRQPSTT